MDSVLKSATILLGVTGSVAAYKSIELTRRLRDEGASVKVIMTEASSRFVTPLSLELASGTPVCCDMFASPLAHISLPAEAGLFIIAPATAHIISSLAQGTADDLMSTAFLAYRGPLVIAPAMNWRMWEHPMIQRNLKCLTDLGAGTVGPNRGVLACGSEGMGRMAEVEEIVEAARTALTPHDLVGQQVLITAGPTREALDPVRYLTNRSSGRMGYAVATVARRRGAEVTLVSGPTHLLPPFGCEVVNVESAEEMRAAVTGRIGSATVLIMAAAVADYSPAARRQQKIEKVEDLTLHLVKTADILREVGHLKARPLTVGFSAETGPNVGRARKKLMDKGVDMMIFNDVTKAGSGFDVETNEVVIIERDGERLLPLMAKEAAATAILDRVVEMLKERRGAGHAAR